MLITDNKRKWVVFIFSCILVISIFAFDSEQADASVTNAKTPVGLGNAHIKWQRQFGTGYANAVTPPLIVGNHMYIGSGGVMYKLNKNTGAILDKLKVEGVFGYTTVAPAYNGKDTVFVPISKGRIAAINVSGSKMKKLWTSKSFGDQAIVPIVCHGDYIYTGSYGPNTYDSAGNGTSNLFVAIEQKSGKVIKVAENRAEKGSSDFEEKNKQGFYWTGAYVSDRSVVFGEEANKAGKSLIRSVKLPQTGQTGFSQVIDSVEVAGPIRSSIVREGAYLYFVSKAKYLYKVKYNDANGTLSDLQKTNLTGGATGVPTIHNGRAYVGTSAGKVDVINIQTMKRMYSIVISGYAQGEMLLSTGNKGRLCLYAAYNTPVGGMYYMEPGASKAKSSGQLLIPDHKQYCISPVITDSEGMLYYKNDSGYIMALEKGYFGSRPKITSAKAGKKKATLSWKKVSGADGYELYRAVKKTGKYKKVATIKKSANGKNVKEVGAIKYVNKKLKRGKKYYYKIRAFRTAGAKTVRTGYSNIKVVKSK